jgi:hypothetical protein
MSCIVIKTGVVSPLGDILTIGNICDQGQWGPEVVQNLPLGVNHYFYIEELSLTL